MKGLEQQRAAEPFNLNREVGALLDSRPPMLKLLQAHELVQPVASIVSRGLQLCGREQPQASRGM